ncbi:hypothetical protein M6B22_16020 [Jatrophihabitans cynanchi]|jgi:hypothetical protein|uniref:Uncharacterized protein n=1 Tax=Jatrophihabitans cynanchi TaxID=2944128 RepID=A0ABY7JU08_9ACTN|nr:hypothetical protein [Jatrophihabitans sp. SB3-54]WAX56033.1 hypothetical protein M6B22_16020 [Jatrophihabitans sp. SB3-54]
MDCLELLGQSIALGLAGLEPLGKTGHLGFCPHSAVSHAQQIMAQPGHLGYRLTGHHVDRTRASLTGASRNADT